MKSLVDGNDKPLVPSEASVQSGRAVELQRGHVVLETNALENDTTRVGSYDSARDETVLPPTAKGRSFELRGLGLREFALVRHDAPLDPFALARYAKLLVVDFDEIKGLSQEARQHLLGDAADAWSGGTASSRLPNGWRLVILNPNHGPQRNNATLMEEVCHVFLGHKPSRLAIIAENKQGKMIARDYNEEDEEAAYAVGAAALVPFAALRRFVAKGKTSLAIARHFRVSRDLVEYRIKVSLLWKEYKARHSEELLERRRKAAPKARKRASTGERKELKDGS